MVSQGKDTTVLIPDRLTEELLKAPKDFARIFFPLMIAWTVIVPTLIWTEAFSVTKNPLVILALIIPVYFINPVVRKFTLGKPARELSSKIREVTGCDNRMEHAIFTALKTAPWNYRTPRYELIINVEEDQLYVHRRLAFAEDLSSVTIGPVTRNVSR
jgi:hypothetical protein